LAWPRGHEKKKDRCRGGDPPVCPSRALRVRGTGDRPLPNGGPAPVTSTRTPPTTSARSAYSVQRSPSVVFHPGVFLAAACPRASARGRAGPALGSPLKRPVPQAPLRPASGPKDSSPGVCFPTTRANTAGPVYPGIPLPGTFRPQGLITLPTACSPPRLVTARRPHSAHGIHPSRPCSSRPAVPLSGSRLSCRFPAPPASGPRGRDSRGLLRSGRGPSVPARARRLRDLAFLGFAPPGLSPAPPRIGFPIHAPLALPAGNAPYGIFPDGASGVRV
jgi:hypothetical protein